MEQNITNGFLKISNPQLQQNSTFNYVGNIENFDFASIVRSQLKNYITIQTLLNSQQIYFTEINIVKWNSEVGHGNPARCKFIIKTSLPNLMWYKYDAQAPGGGNNLIYYKKQKIKTTNFITLNENELIQLLQS